MPTPEPLPPLPRRLAVVVGQVATIVVTWPLWNARDDALPLVPGPRLDFGWLLLLSCLAALRWPVPATLVHWGVLVAAILMDQTREQPQVLSLALLLLATWPRPWAARVVILHLAALWFFAGLGKLTSARFLTAAELEPWLGDARVVVRTWALRRVATMGASAAPIVGELVPLLAAMATRGDALGVVQQLGPHAAAIAPELVRWLDDAERFDVAVAALAGIGPAAAEVAAAPLVRFVTQPSRGEHGERMRFENRVLTAVAALAAIAPEQAVDALWPGFLAPLPSPWPGEWVLVTRFCCVGAAGAAKLPELRRLLASDDRNDRLRALMALRGLGAPAAPALGEVLPLVHDVDEFVGREATAAVLAMGPAAAPALPELDRAFTVWPEHRRRELVPGLAAIGPAAEPLLLRALREGDEGTRQLAAVQLWQAKTISAAAMTVMAESPETIVLDCYLRRRWPELCRVEVPWTRWTAGSYVGELTRLLWASRAAPPAGDQRRPWREEGTLTEWVLGFAGHQDATVRAAVAHVLGLLPSTPATLAALRELASDGDRNTRLAALWALGRPAARAAADVLVAALRDDDWSVAATADMALRGVFVR